MLCCVVAIVRVCVRARMCVGNSSCVRLCGELVCAGGVCVCEKLCRIVCERLCVGDGVWELVCEIVGDVVCQMDRVILRVWELVYRSVRVCARRGRARRSETGVHSKLVLSVA